jgi:hypothetical protein
MLRRRGCHGFGAAACNLAPTAGVLVTMRGKATHYSDTIRDFKHETDADYDTRHRPTYAKKRQEDAIAFSIKERELLEKQTLLRLKNEQHEQSKGERPYQRSIERFPERRKITRSHAGTAENRIIQTWENIWYNWIRYFFKLELLIAKDRYGNRFFSKWNFYRPRQEVRMCFRADKSMDHIPYGQDPEDDQQWLRWMKHHRGEPPTVAEEEHLRKSKKEASGPLVHEHESFEDAWARAVAQVPEMGGVFDDKDFQTQEQDSLHRTVKPARMREQENMDPSDELGKREQESGTDQGAKGVKPKGTWHQVFTRPDLFYNEEESDVLRSEVQHMFRSMEWQQLEYKRQVRVRNAQPPHGMPEDVWEHGDVDAATKAAEPLKMIWERIDLGIPYHDAVPDLSSPELERMRLEADQLEDHRLAFRLELGLTDLGDIREGRPPIDKGEEPYRRPLSKKYKPKVWDEQWGQASFRGWE